MTALTPAANAFAADQCRPRRRRDEQLREHAGVAFPDDVDAVEDRDEHCREGPAPGMNKSWCVAVA
jgi:hypothetical protein